MTSIEQTQVATAPDAPQAPEASSADQPNTVNTVPATATAAPAAAKKIRKTPVKKVAQPVPATEADAVKPGVTSAAKETRQAATRPVAKTVATKTSATKPAAKKTVTPPAVSAAPLVAARAATKPAVKAASQAPITPVAKPLSTKLLKAKKPKLVRDSFTIPKLEYLVLEELKQRSGKLGNSIKKGELIRAGIKALAAMSDASLLAALKAVPAIKTGRPANG